MKIKSTGSCGKITLFTILSYCVIHLLYIVARTAAVAAAALYVRFVFRPLRTIRSNVITWRPAVWQHCGRRLRGHRQATAAVRRHRQVARRKREQWPPLRRPLVYRTACYDDRHSDGSRWVPSACVFMVVLSSFFHRKLIDYDTAAAVGAYLWTT